MYLKTLVVIHVLAVIVWIGFGLYELLLHREIRKSRGTAVEIALIRISGRYGGLVALATLVVAITGVLMTQWLGLGYFRLVWLGMLQGIMLAVLLDMAWLTPTFLRLAREIKALPDTPGRELDRARATLEQVHPHVLWMRIGALVAVVFAVFQPA